MRRIGGVSEYREGDGNSHLTCGNGGHTPLM